MTTATVFHRSKPRGEGFWLIMCAAALILMLAFACGGRIVALVYPALALWLACLTLLTSPPLHIVTVFWIWLLTPFIRRLADYSSGFDGLNPIMVAPLLAMLPSLALFAARLGGGPKQRDLPYLIASLGLTYAYAVGVVKAGPLPATHALMNWLLPIAFGHFIACHYRSYPHAAAGMRRFAVQAGLLLGVYGVWQFFAPPPWDAYWMSHVPMTNIGTPEPYQVRVFSMLNSPGTFGLGIMAILVLLLPVRTPWRFLAMGPALTALLLSLVRAAWGGWLLACLTFLGLARGRTRGVMVFLVPSAALLALAILSSGHVAHTIAGRLASVSNISSDQSFQDRVDFHLKFAAQAFGNPLGHGLGATGLSSKLSGAERPPGAPADFDSGVMNIAFELGWPGAAAYVTSVAMLFIRALRTAPRQDEFAVASLAIALSVLAQLIFVNTLTGFGGLLFFSFVSLASAAGESRRYGAGATP